MLTWRGYFVLAIGLGFLVTLYRNYTPPTRPWPTHPVDETEFEVPDRDMD